MSTENETLFRVYEDLAKPATCKGCGAVIVWHETLKGKKMPVNADAVPRKSERENSNWRTVLFFASADAHWSTCPNREDFKR